jgi:hypothetical protein
MEELSTKPRIFNSGHAYDDNYNRKEFNWYKQLLLYQVNNSNREYYKERLDKYYNFYKKDDILYLHYKKDNIDKWFQDTSELEPYWILENYNDR